MEYLKNPALIAAAVGHFAVDLFAGMLPVILVVLAVRLPLSYSQVGAIVMCSSLASSLAQPLFGWLGDRFSPRLLAVLGVLVAALGTAGMGYTSDITALMALAGFAGLGSAMFHPQGAVLAAQAPLEKRGSAISVYMVGGSAGFALGAIVWNAINNLSAEHTPLVLVVLGLLQVLLVAAALDPRRAPSPSHARAEVESTRGAAMRIIIAVGLILFLRSWASASITTFVPQLLTARGHSTGYAANVLFAILAPLAVGNLLGGGFSDRVGPRKVLIVSTAAIAPALWGVIGLQGAAALVCAPLLGIANGAALPMTLIMAQRLFPRGIGFMSGMALGFTFVAGAIGVWFNGYLADRVGLLPMLALNAIAPLLAALLSFVLPDDRPQRAQEAALEAEAAAAVDA